MGVNRARHKFALGVRQMLISIIRDHRRADMLNGRPPRMPRQFLLHPLHIHDLAQELNILERQELNQPNGERWFHGVRIYEKEVTTAIVVTADDRVEYL